MITPVTASETGTKRSGSHWARRIIDDPRVRYLVVGGTAALFYYVAFSALWLSFRGFRVHLLYLVAAVIANALTAVAFYPLYRKRVFRATGPWWPGLRRFYVISLWPLLFSLILLPPLVELMHVRVLVAQAVIIVITPLINYPINKRWTFRSTPTPEPAETGRFDTEN